MANILFVVQSGSQFVEPFQITSLIGDSGECRLLHSLVSVSSGNRAIACGQPLVNYDVYRYNCQDYSNVGGFLARNNKKDFVGALNRLTEERVYYDQIADAKKKLLLTGHD